MSFHTGHISAPVDVPMVPVWLPTYVFLLPVPVGYTDVPPKCASIIAIIQSTKESRQSLLFQSPGGSDATLTRPGGVQRRVRPVASRREEGADRETVQERLGLRLGLFCVQNRKRQKDANRHHEGTRCCRRAGHGCWFR